MKMTAKLRVLEKKRKRRLAFKEKANIAKAARAKAKREGKWVKK